MNRELAQLIEVLENLVETARALRATSKQKCSALAAMKLDLIQQATENEEALTRQLRELHDLHRQRLVSLMEGEMPSSTTPAAGDATLGRLIEKLQEPERTRLSVLRTELAEVTRDVQFVNITNSIVSRRSLRHLRELLGLLSGAGPPDSRYDRNGAVSRDVGPSGLVNQIA